MTGFGARHGRSGRLGRCPPASNCSIWPKPNAPAWVQAHLGKLTHAMSLSAASLAYADGGVALRVHGEHGRYAAGAGIFRRRAMCAP